MFSKLPQEIQEAILLEAVLIRPSLVATLAQTCKSLHELVYQPTDSHLWRSIFLAIFDDPRKSQAIETGSEESECWVDWSYEARQRFRAQIRMDRATIIELAEFNKVIDDDAADALWEVAHTGLPAGYKDFRNGQWLADCFRSAIMPPVKNPAHAKLHIIASFLPVTTSVSLIPLATTSSRSTRLASRAYAYDLRHYTESNQWGPWLPGSHGAVNWIHVWHLLDVLRHNAHERGCTDLPSRGIGKLRAHSAPKQILEDAPANEWNDWAGVQGVWLRAVSFMDYRDLHAYNFSGNTRPDGSYSTSIFQDIQFAEAFRLIKAYFTVVKVDKAGLPAYPNRPTIHFIGDLGPAADAESHHIITKGTVSMTKHGHVRWSFCTRVGGHQWASEGVQLGGVQSQAGVIGVWSSAVHEATDPAGPFWLWKSDEGKAGAKAPHMHHYHYAS
ncbi:hypothetical protein M408DRAFT_198453 [Serendipita vermifera MAFF 305830]|uniref:F-box domain-containing protein n=1 Tax=Serendipita vermifera MAFF 305830 TaxID=933852 RepID=A0A0C3B1D3_SERVB|nr:hypothetical protein M408DRAFT_198453 [Serendipita vermifera MAFF 305830]